MLHVALKEWAIICDLLVEGEQALLLRKGGISEAAGPGRFRLEAPRFALFPAWLHQRPERIKPRWRDRVQQFDHEPAEVTIRGVGAAEHVWRVPSRNSLDALDELHAWTADQLDMRWNYKPNEPLYLLAVKVFRLADPHVITNNPHYAGCKSWVSLDQADAIDESGAKPVLADEQFDSIVTRVEAAML